MKFKVRIDPSGHSQLRHSEAETGQIFVRLDVADPRVALMVEVCGEQRAGQVIRATRRDLHLESTGDAPHGYLDIRRHGLGNKNSTKIVLHPEARALIDHLLSTGYLADLEEAYRDGSLKDYHLWPAGKLRNGRMVVARYSAGPKRRDRNAEVREGPKHMNPGSLIALFHDFERAIGLTPMKGRAFYGLRRTLADLGADHTTDTRVLREVTGWKSEQTRRDYQQRLDPKVLKAAAQTRQSVRDAARSTDKEGTTESTLHHGIDLSALSLEQLQALLEDAKTKVENEK